MGSTELDEMFDCTVCRLQLWPTADASEGIKKEGKHKVILQNTLPAAILFCLRPSCTIGAFFFFVQ